MEFSLRTTSHLENDREVDFESFQYILNFRTAVGAAGARPIQLPAIALVVFALHRRLEIAGMLVELKPPSAAKFSRLAFNGGR
jgi:hypothetical protein